MRTSRIRATLETIGAINADNVVKLADRTRDAEVPVFIDRKTGVIFIEDFYVGDLEYEDGRYRDGEGPVQFEDLEDTRRRAATLRKHYVGRRIVDFGCGAGSFLLQVRGLATEAYGVELQGTFRDELRKQGVECFSTIDELPSLVDTAFAFHVIEHLPDPILTLKNIAGRLAPTDGVLVVEVPHANDFLLRSLRSQAFLDFTLWSQHLVLHTRESLHLLLSAAGYDQITISGVQRYGLSNHITWGTLGVPGGHRGQLSFLDEPALFHAYQAVLAAHDQTDTLIAVARRGS